MEQYNPLILKDKATTYSPTFNQEYPKKKDVEVKAVMAWSLPQLLELFQILSKLRRVPPGTVKDYGVWEESLYGTDEAGVLMRVAQTSLITKADVIPNVNGTNTYVVDSGMSFKSLKSGNRVFVTNLEITVHIPHTEEIDIHCFETNCSVFLKWDTCFKFSKVGKDTYKVCLPGFHALDKRCINKLKLVFTASLPKHLPINVLLTYDYVFLRYQLADTVYDILRRYTCIRVNGELGIKLIPRAENTRPELFIVEKNNLMKTGDAIIGNDGVSGIKSLFSATKYKKFTDDDADEHKKILDELDKSLGPNWSINNAQLLPENGYPDVCGVSYMFSGGEKDKSLSIVQKIIVVCVQMIIPDDYPVIKQLQESNSVLLETINNVTRLSTDEDNHNNMMTEFTYNNEEEYERVRHSPRYSTNEFVNIITTNTCVIIDKLTTVNKVRKEKLKQETSDYISNIKMPEFPPNQHLFFLRTIVLGKILNSKPAPTPVCMVKKPEKFWDLKQFDTVFTEKYDDFDEFNDDFGPGPKQRRHWHFH